MVRLAVLVLCAVFWFIPVAHAQKVNQPFTVRGETFTPPQPETYDKLRAACKKHFSGIKQEECVGTVGVMFLWWDHAIGKYGEGALIMKVARNTLQHSGGEALQGRAALSARDAQELLLWMQREWPQLFVDL